MCMPKKDDIWYFLPSTKSELNIIVSAVGEEGSAPISPVALAREQFLGKYL